MVLDTTYYNKEHKQLFDNFVGKPYTFFEAIKRRGIGSKRMIVDKVSPNLNPILNTVSDINYANIEMRKKGILIHITKGLKNFTWAIPFYHLVLYKTDGMSIHAQGRFIHFKKSKNFYENKNFLRSLLEEKVLFDEQFKIPVS
ncbi:MAG: hypothetical protein P8M66_01665 [Flavobacteriaceae bacterium]|nr:hypothetical protein [Formosa sp.]MDG1374859.1 hypothetical protein [Flavobacteriaceae bacterium]MDG2498202.1 hypothetical protein [Flavobacteriaceae bacterium]